MPDDILQNIHQSAQVIWPDSKESPQGLKGKAKQAPREVGEQTLVLWATLTAPRKPGEPTWGQTETESQIRGPA